MTDEQKETLIARMLDTPDALSASDLETILHDEELRAIYDTSVALSNACVHQPEFDVDVEWRRFSARIHRKPSAWQWVMRVAAIFLGVAIASGIAVRVTDVLFTSGHQAEIAESDSHNVAPALPSQPMPKTADEPITESLIIHHRPAVPARHIAKAEISRPSQYNADQVETDFGIDEYLRIQQARTDNDLARQVAESYIEELNDLAPILDAVGVYDAEFESEIRNITME